jgi:hypothetical protein
MTCRASIFSDARFIFREHYVLGHGKIRQNVQVLKNNGYPHLAALPGVGDSDRPAVEDYSPGVITEAPGQDIHER